MQEIFFNNQNNYIINDDNLINNIIMMYQHDNHIIIRSGINFKDGINTKKPQLNSWSLKYSIFIFLISIAFSIMRMKKFMGFLS